MPLSYAPRIKPRLVVEPSRSLRRLDAFVMQVRAVTSFPPRFGSRSLRRLDAFVISFGMSGNFPAHGSRSLRRLDAFVIRGVAARSKTPTPNLDLSGV